MEFNSGKLICVKDSTSNSWTVYPKNISGIVVQVDNLEDAPKKVAKLLEVMFRHGFENNLHEIVDYGEFK